MDGNGIIDFSEFLIVIINIQLKKRRILSLKKKLYILKDDETIIKSRRICRRFEACLSSIRNFDNNFTYSIFKSFYIG